MNAGDRARSHPAWREERYFCHDLTSTPCPEIGTVLVTGASGYIGGRLVPELLARGYRVRAMVRAHSPEYVKWWPGAEVVASDALDRDSLYPALEGIHTAYYLIHSMVLGPSQFVAADLQAAANFRQVAERMGVERIIYLGGLGQVMRPLSDHLRSRLEVAQELQRGSVQVTILRAAIIIGSGSASYEIILHLVRNLPVIFIPVWAQKQCQPIGIRDVIKYLVGVLETPDTRALSFDIGGKDILTYEEMLKTLADILHKKRLFVSSPVSNLNIFSYFLSLITPIPVPIAICLMEGLKNHTICEDQWIRKFLPFKPLSYREAIVRAMSREEQDTVATRWSDAYPPAHELAIKLYEIEEPLAYKAVYSLQTEKAAPCLFNAICQIGGREGWFHNNWMWRLRGAADRILFGVGSVRGRRSRASLKINDVIDFWRVEDLQPDRRLLLRAEMRLPGKAWLEFRIKNEEDRKNELYITAYYDCRGLFGKIYWYIFLPFHGYIFETLLRQIEGRCEHEALNA